MYLRLAFSVGAHLESDILLVDEVLAVGVAAFRNKCLASMGDLAGAGRTVLFVSHDLAAVQHLCPQSIALDKGRLLAMGNSREVVSAYLTGASSDADSALGASADGLDLDSISVRQRDSRNPTHLDCNHSFSLEIGYTLRREMRSFLLGFELRSPTGAIVFRSYDFSSDRPTNRSPGRYVSRFDFRERSLRDGTYFIDILAAEHRRGWLLRDRVGLRIQLFDSSPSDVDYPGLVTPTGSWELRSKALVSSHFPDADPDAAQ